jgi:hypothetical protein
MPFQPGVSGNPAGRTKGTGNRQQVFNALVEPHKEALFKTAVDLALNGNEAMLRLFLDRMLPAKPTDEPIHIDIPSGDFNNTQTISHVGLESLKAVISGKITPEEAMRMSALIGVHYKMFEVIELMQEIRNLKENIIEKTNSESHQS